MTWMEIATAPAASAGGAAARDIAPDEDAAVESAMRLVDGQITSARGVSGRVMKLLEEDGRVVGATIVHPDFPGASPFRVARPELALVLLRALRAYARPEQEQLMVLTEDQPDVAEALLAAGATVRLEAVHLRGPLPA